MQRKTIIFIFTLFINSSCTYLFQPNPLSDMDAKIIDVYPAVYNLKDLNTKYDEYNSSPISYRFYRSLVTDSLFTYSTNSGTEGKNFDIWKGSFTFIQQSRLRGKKNPEPLIKSERIAPFLKDEVNTDFNEFGPYLFYNPKTETSHIKPPQIDEEGISEYGYSKDLYLDSNNYDALVIKDGDENKIKEIYQAYSNYLAKKTDKELIGENLYFFASGKNGDLDIYFYSPKFGIRAFFGNKKGSNERYFTYDYRQHTIYFASDREDGKYHIYKYENKDKNLNFSELFNNKDLEKEIVKVNSLSSENNDTCPVIVGDYMVFASDRKESKGGYDIFISTFGFLKDKPNMDWSKPINIQDLVDNYYKGKGSKIPKDELKNLNIQINTKYDEFRPFIIENEFNSQYAKVNNTENYERSYDNPSITYEKPSSMIFSSNRPEGKGGFDLYLGIVPNLQITDY
ncbi:MAG: hypothetical protein U0354_02960 [Candidatus Sericytochromatia bacterium]